MNQIQFSVFNLLRNTELLTVYLYYIYCFFLSRCDDKSGGRGDFLCVRSNTRSHERSPRVHQWHLQGWCESPPLLGPFIKAAYFRKTTKKQSLTTPYPSADKGSDIDLNMRLFACVYACVCINIQYMCISVLCCSKNSSWSLVLSTLPPSLRYGKIIHRDV